MTDRDQTFLEQWSSSRPVYQRWGDFIVSHLSTRLEDRLGVERFENFIRLPVKCRIKDDSSLLEKAFYRKEKRYKNPFQEIEDKVGIRFVLLLAKDMHIVAEEIENETDFWTAVKSRDHELEIEDNPSVFDYQSIHYVVRSTNSVEYNDEKIPADIPCEIQVRTLLQHAYSELTHDTIYKPSVAATPKMKRAAAKSMALIEATGDFFNEVDKLILDKTEPMLELSQYLQTKYIEFVGTEPESMSSAMNQLIVDNYGQFHAEPSEAISALLLDKQFIADRIRERSITNATFRLSAILLVYFYVATEPRRAAKNSPLLDNDLELIFGDLGTAMYG